MTGIIRRLWPRCSSSMRTANRAESSPLVLAHYEKQQPHECWLLLGWETKQKVLAGTDENKTQDKVRKSIRQVQGFIGFATFTKSRNVLFVRKKFSSFSVHFLHRIWQNMKRWINNWNVWETTPLTISFTVYTTLVTSSRFVSEKGKIAPCSIYNISWC